MISTNVAVVTGANKGIGYAIVKGLCEKFNGKVYLTARDENCGMEAVKKLKEFGLNPKFHQLDINNTGSINKFRDYIEANEGGIDVLVNNAGILFKNNATEPVGVQAEITIETNYYGIIRVCDLLFPILRPGAQVVNVSSSVGHLSAVPSPELRAKFSDPNLTVEQLNKLMNQFIQDAKDEKHVKYGWPKLIYAMSKVGVSAFTIIHQREFDKEVQKRNISVNSVHPGYVTTDMTSHQGFLTIEEGANAPLFLALGGHQLQGQYIWHDSTVVDWYASDTPARY